MWVGVLAWDGCVLSNTRGGCVESNTRDWVGVFEKEPEGREEKVFGLLKVVGRSGRPDRLEEEVLVRVVSVEREEGESDRASIGCVDRGAGGQELVLVGLVLVLGTVE